ncbi:hypothetical protein DY000_02053717 [Brassica cretica]|uniref:Uncharacterized protein n=1 Tax=Brassica cretica TaxID=69181 RepID=A0ABQ7AH03_BRACR|nr:hypothetical protein DY000_02053717 [Brassica cretica]
MINIDYTARTTQVEPPSSLAIHDTPGETPVVEKPGVVGVNELQSRLREEFRDGVLEISQAVVKQVVDDADIQVDKEKAIDDELSEK